MKPVIIYVATDPETNQVTWLVSGSVATQIMTGFMITISSCHSSLTWLVSGSVATQIMTGFMITISADPETNQVRLE
jgi:hypothetical protein